MGEPLAHSLEQLWIARIQRELEELECSIRKGLVPAALAGGELVCKPLAGPLARGRIDEADPGVAMKKGVEVRELPRMIDGASGRGEAQALEEDPQAGGKLELDGCLGSLGQQGDAGWKRDQPSPSSRASARVEIGWSASSS